MKLGHVEKQPAEVFPVSVDYAKDLSDGETLSTAAVTARKLFGDLGDSTADVLQGGHTIDGTKVIQKVKTGLTGENHRLTMKATSSAGNVYEHEVDLRVREI